MSKPMSISRMIELSRAVKMTEEQWEEQRRGFAFGNTAFENPNITREMIDEIADKLKAQ